MVHGFTCTGILPSQYAHLTQFADLENIGHSYIRQGLFEFLCNTTCTFMVYMYILSSVYQRMGYIEIVGRAAHHSMMAAVETLKELPEYTTNKGEVCMCTNIIWHNGYSISLAFNFSG